MPSNESAISQVGEWVLLPMRAASHRAASNYHCKVDRLDDVRLQWQAHKKLHTDAGRAVCSVPLPAISQPLPPLTGQKHRIAMQADDE